MIVQSECFVNDYAWEGSITKSYNSDIAKTILQVSFDYGAQRLFSSVCITVYYAPTEEELLQDQSALDFERPFRVSVSSLGNAPCRPKPSSLPVFNAIFEIERSSDPRDMYGRVALIEDLDERPLRILFQVNQPLTADTRNISVSFTHSLLLHTPGPHGTRPLDGSFTVGRILRVQPVVLPFNHRGIPVPAEILFMVFGSLADLWQVYEWWRRDLISCALVCKKWTPALNLLLSDFRFHGRIHQKGYPPEISSFANTLTLRPNLALSITHLSSIYFLAHASWKDLDYPGRLISTRVGELSPRFQEFLASMTTILRLAKNLRSLSLSWAWRPDLPKDFLDAIRGLDKLEEFHGSLTNSAEETYPYLAMWPTLKRLEMGLFCSARSQPPPTPPKYALTEARLWVLGDAHLKYILSSSSSSLERLFIRDPLLTDGGLHTVLQGVAMSLVTLHISFSGLLCGDVLDSLVVLMNRLETLWIDSDVATDKMITRRSDAFQRSRMLGSRTVLPVIKLTISRNGPGPWSDHSLVKAAGKVWPGWEIKLLEPSEL